MIQYLIVGSGAAGMAAAEAIRRDDKKGEIKILSMEKAGYYSRPALAYYLSKEINEKSLFPFSNRDYKTLDIKLAHTRATKIDPQKKVLILDDSKRLYYDRLLLTPGAAAVHPQLDGAGLDGVFYLDSLAQTKKMILEARRGKRAIVIGGGITALEIVEGLRARKMEVHFFLRGQLYWNRVLDTVESEIILRRLENDGVAIHRNTEAEKLIGKNGKVTQVITKNGEVLDTNLVAFAIGVRPRIELAKETGIDVNRGIKVNSYMETNLDSIFAAGDAAEVYNSQTGSWIVDSLWPIARHQGKIAGQNMTGNQIAYQRKSPLNVTRLSGLTTTIIGTVGTQPPDDEFSIVRGESETWQLLPDAVICQNNFDINRVRLMVGREHILGAVLIGDQSLSRTLEELITKQINIKTIRDLLLKPDANLGSILLEFWIKRNKNDD